MRVLNTPGGHVDYRLRILGIRVWRGHAQLIARDGELWEPLGFKYSLPIQIPATADELKAAATDTLRLTAWQYDQEHSGSDIRDVLSQKSDFLSASAD